jgi:hypothetical protein
VTVNQAINPNLRRVLAYTFPHHILNLIHTPLGIGPMALNFSKASQVMKAINEF